MTHRNEPTPIALGALACGMARVIFGLADIHQRADFAGLVRGAGIHDDDIDAGLDGGLDGTGQHVEIGQRGDDAVGAGGRGLVDDAGPCRPGRRWADCGTRPRRPSADLPSAMPFLMVFHQLSLVGRMADEDVAFALGGCGGGAQCRRCEHRNGQSELSWSMTSWSLPEFSHRLHGKAGPPAVSLDDEKTTNSRILQPVAK